MRVRPLATAISLVSNRKAKSVLRKDCSGPRQDASVHARAFMISVGAEGGKLRVQQEAGQRNNYSSK